MYENTYFIEIVRATLIQSSELCEVEIKAYIVLHIQKLKMCHRTAAHCQKLREQHFAPITNAIFLSMALPTMLLKFLPNFCKKS